MGHAVGDDRGLEGHNGSSGCQGFGDLVGEAEWLVHRAILAHGSI